MNIQNKILGLSALIAALFFGGCASDGNKRSTGEAIDDAAIHTKVKAALINDPIVHGSEIAVHVDRGVVSLSGAVNGDVERRKAEDIARGVEGVRSVEDNIMVRH